MDTTLTSFIWVWITLLLVVNLFGIVGLFIGADSTWQALQEVKEIYSPFNVMNWLFGTVDPVSGIGRLRVARTASTIPTSSLTTASVGVAINVEAALRPQAMPSRLTSSQNGGVLLS